MLTFVTPPTRASLPMRSGDAGPEEIGPTDFERRAGRGQSKKWKESVKVYGQPSMSIGRWLAQQGAPAPVRSPCQGACCCGNAQHCIMCTPAAGLVLQVCQVYCKA